MKLPSNRHLVANSLGILMLSTLSGGSALAAPAPAEFAMCASCHRTAASAPAAIGPNLWGVAGRKAGTLDRFNFSPAMKKSNITWSRETLAAFITDPRQSVPGNRMAYAGQRDPKKVNRLVTYLLMLK